MKLFAINDVTWTPGATNWIWTENTIIQKQFIFDMNLKNHPLIQEWVKSYNDYMDYYNSWSKQWKIRLKNKLDNLSKKLLTIYWTYIDPIEYIIKLYYWEWLSISDVYKRLNELWWDNKNESSIEKAFKITFWWQLRDSSWTEISRKKRNFPEQISKAREEINKKNKKKYDFIKNVFKNDVNRILETKLDEFDFIGFESLNKTWKVLYIFYFLYWINRKELQELNKKWIWSKVILNHIKNDLQWFLKEINIKLNIYPKDIQAIFN